MLIHKKIRHQVSDMLKSSIKGVENIYSGRPLFIDIDQEKTAIAVFLDEISCEELDLCHHEYTAALNIAIYLKTAVGDDALDEIAEQIKQRLESAIANDELSETISEIDLMSYEYEQDTTNRTWFVSNLKYQIKYED
ncbi:phage tail terminator protein [Haemophilus influenzae]|uniref:phage tail terminator protein n=1 Tax=Haemophilus influenzae TaxID=727 RepID=UPI000DD45238|nr:phage tail terminator protein [Haemophilus influenzae]